MSTDNRKYTSLRQNVTTRIHDIISNRKCLHWDIWLVQLDDDSLVFVMRTAAGGIVELEREAYAVEGSALKLLPAVPAGVTRHINSPWALRTGHAAVLEALHWRSIVPALRTPRAGFRYPYSVALHYVWSDPRVSDPWEGLPNLYAVTGRRARDDARRKVALTDSTPRIPLNPDTIEPDNSRWNERERSTLRTIGKLLRPNTKNGTS